MTQSTQMIEELDDCFLRTAANIAKYYVNEKESQNMLKELRSAIEENCIESAKMKAAVKIKEQLELESDSSPGGNMQNIIKKYEKAISEIKVDLSTDSRLLEYDRQLEELLQGDEAASSNALDDSDTDLRLTGKDVNVIDPISKTRMRNPVKNTVCGHIYDRESLTAMLQKNKNTRCPVIGCTSTDYINLSQCRIDIVTKLYLEKNPA